MHKTRASFFKIIFSTCILLVFFVGLTAITSSGVEYLKNTIYKERLETTNKLNSVIVSNLNVSSSLLDGLQQGDAQVLDEVSNLLNKKIHEVDVFNILSEDILNVVIVDVRDSSSIRKVYKYDSENNADENDSYSFLGEDDIVLLTDNSFVTYKKVIDDEQNVISYVGLYTSRSSYDKMMLKVDRSYRLVEILYFLIILYLFLGNFFKIKRAQNTDTLTGLVSKRQYKKDMQKIIAKHPSDSGVLYVIGFRDLYDFEAPNTEIIEDIVYKFANILKKCRSSKTVVARISERKLGLYIHDIKNNDELLEKILKDVEKLLRSRVDYQNIQYYMGVAFYPEHEKTVDALVNGAIYALETLRKGKKQYHIRNFQLYDPTSRKEFVDKQYLYDEVEKVINERRVYSVFQPIVDIKTGTIMGYEALSRPISELIPNIGMLISLATEMGIMTDLELLLIYIINKTVFDFKDSFLDKYLFINTNVSIKYGDKELSKFKSTIEKITQNLVVELTEYDEIDFETITSRINKVKDFGAKIAIDDFGSGYSNELALLSLKPDIVKIDMGLIRNIDKDQRKLQIVENLTRYAANNGIKVLAEGVETSAELRVIRDLNIDYVQGFIFAKPEKNVLQKEFDVEEYIRKDIR